MDNITMTGLDVIILTAIVGYVGYKGYKHWLITKNPEVREHSIRMKELELK